MGLRGPAAGQGAPTDGSRATSQRAVCLTQFLAQSLSNIAWSFAKPEHNSARCEDVLDSVAAAAMELGMNEFTDQGLANLAWSCAADAATRFQKSGGVSGERDASSIDEVARFPPQACANLLWAAATCDAAQELDVRAVSASLERNVPKMTAQQISMVCWAGAWLGSSLILLP